MLIFVLIVVLTAAISTLVISFVYGIIFDMHMKKIYDSGSDGKKKWIVPRKMSLIWFCAVTVVGLAIALPVFFFDN